MTNAAIAQSVPMLVLYAASFVVVLWAVVDVARRAPALMAPGRKAVWIIAFVVGWLVFGVIGAALAVVYLVGPRRRLNAARF
jgi:hypothetical protein